MSKDFAAFLDALNKNGAAYVVIGGMAVLSHVPYRTTRDIDVLIKPNQENAVRVRNAVAEWGGFEPDFTADEFIRGDILSFGGLLRVEIHSSVPGADWEKVWQNKIPGQLMGVETWFASLEDLISMKEAADRAEKDRPDLRRLRNLLRKSRE